MSREDKLYTLYFLCVVCSVCLVLPIVAIIISRHSVKAKAILALGLSALTMIILMPIFPFVITFIGLVVNQEDKTPNIIRVQVMTFIAISLGLGITALLLAVIANKKKLKVLKPDQQLDFWSPKNPNAKMKDSPSENFLAEVLVVC